MKACRENDTVIRLPEGIYDLSDEGDEDVADIGFFLAKRYKRTMIKNTTLGLYRKAKDGEFTGGRLRIGYRYKRQLVESAKGTKLTCDWEIELEEIRVSIFVHEHFPRYSTRRWAMILNRLAKWGRIPFCPIKLKRDQLKHGKTFRAWTQRDITRIIRNKMLIGRLPWANYTDLEYRTGRRRPSRYLKNSEPVLAYRQDLQVIGEDVFYRNNAILDARGKLPHRTVGSPYAFTSMLLCPSCLQPLHSHGSKSHKYICPTYQRMGKTECPGFIVHELAARDLLLPIVTEFLQQHIGSAVEFIKRQVRDEGAISKLRAEIEQIDRQLENLMMYAREGALAPAQLREQNLNLMRDNEEKQAKIARLKQRIVNHKSVERFAEKFNKDLPTYIEFLYQRKKNAFNYLLRMLFDGVVLNSHHRGRRWKKGLKLKYGRATPRPCYVERYLWNPQTRDWIQQANLKIPILLESALEIGNSSNRDAGGESSLNFKIRAVRNELLFFFARICKILSLASESTASVMKSNSASSERARANQAMFARIAPRYDLMNRLMTAGMDVAWRREMLQRAELSSGVRVLDIGTGTGDIAREISEQHPVALTIAADYTFEMMLAGKQSGRALNFSSADALRLPFADEMFDAVVSGFLLRNVTDLDRALREQYRVLKPNGRFVALDTTRPEKNLLSPFIQFHLQTIIPTLGRFITGQDGAYSYLTASTANFLRAEDLADRARAAGFHDVGFARKNFGTIAIHWGKK